MRSNLSDNHFLAVDNQQAHNMVYMQWWLTCMLPASDFPLNLITLTRRQNVNATTGSNTFYVVRNQQSPENRKMKGLFIVVLFAGCLTAREPSDAYIREVHNNLTNDRKPGRKRHNVIRQSDGQKVEYMFWDDNKALVQVQTSHGTGSRDTITNYLFRDDKVVCINFGFKKIYSLYYFKDGELMSRVERKQEWAVPNMKDYLQRADYYLSEAKKIQRSIAP